jgi:hypothetical protein
MPSILDEFVAKPPRERSGSRSANRFDYQLSWAFCLLLDLERENKDYLIILDYHDDVVVFDSDTLPTVADFYQIKTETQNHWTLPRLLSRANGSQYSILGKLYAHQLNFGDKVRSLNFIATTQFSLQTNTKPEGVLLEHFLLSDLCNAALTKVGEALKKEHNLSAVPICHLATVFKTDSLSVKDHATHAEGRLSRHLKETFGDKPYHVSHAFNALIDELRRRNNYEGQLQSVAELSKEKALGRKEFSSLINKCAGAGERQKWLPIEQALIQEQLDIFTIKQYEHAWATRELVRLDTSNAIIRQIQDIADQTVKELRDQISAYPLRTFLDRCVARCRERLPAIRVPVSNEDVLGAILSSITTSIP